MKYLVAAILSIVFLQGCYYDKKDLLDPNGSLCDTTIVTYSASVHPILTAYCTGCHSGPNAPLNISLDNYTTVRAQATNGKLIGTITHSSGFIPMPQNGPMLNSCSITKIRKWVIAGAPNN
jgi:hypothetical protein